MSYGYHLCYTGAAMEKRIKAYLLLTEEWLQDKGEKLHRDTKIYILQIRQIVYGHGRNDSCKGMKISNCTKF